MAARHRVPGGAAGSWGWLWAYAFGLSPPGELGR
jgi:hypothetical protein